MFQKIRITPVLIVIFSVSFLILPATVFGIDNIPLDFPIGLKVGDTANVDSDFKMTLLAVEDSRCPSDVTCIWEGTVLSKIQLEKGSQDLGIFTISNESVEENDIILD